MKRTLGLAVTILAAAMLNGACSDDDPADYCHCWCNCGAGDTAVDADSSSECTDKCQDMCGANYVEDINECAD